MEFLHIGQFFNIALWSPQMHMCPHGEMACVASLTRHTEHNDRPVSSRNWPDAKSMCALIACTHWSRETLLSAASCRSSLANSPSEKTTRMEHASVSGVTEAPRRDPDPRSNKPKGGRLLAASGNVNQVLESTRFIYCGVLKRVLPS